MYLASVPCTGGTAKNLMSGSRLYRPCLHAASLLARVRKVRQQRATHMMGCSRSGYSCTATACQGSVMKCHIGLNGTDVLDVAPVGLCWLMKVKVNCRTASHMLSNTAAGFARQAGIWHIPASRTSTKCSLSAVPPGHLVAPAGDARLQGYPVTLLQVSDS